MSALSPRDLRRLESLLGTKVALGWNDKDHDVLRLYDATADNLLASIEAVDGRIVITVEPEAW